MNSFRKALLKIIVLSAVTAVSAGFAVRVFGAVFPDVTEDELYYPYIQSLYSQHLIGGDVRTGTFRPHDSITRAELAKGTAYIRLAEEHGIADGWSGKDDFGMAFAVFDLLKPYFGCGNGACSGIGGVPFADVPESDPKCMDKIDNPNACEPWFSRYIYYAVSRGFIKGYDGTDGKHYFKPLDSMKRIYALKIMLADNGDIDPSYDKRFKELEALADSRDSYSPKCIIGAEGFIKANGGGNTSEAARLLEYAVLADRLDLFGNNCQVFAENGAVTAKQKADFLWKPLTREEVPRYFALTTSYYPASADPDTDPTVNSAEENKGKPASFEYDKGKAVSADSTKTGQDSNGTVIKTGSDSVKQKVTEPVKTTEQVLPSDSLAPVIISSSIAIPLTDENWQSCGTIPAGTSVNLLMAKKGEEGRFWQYTDYDKSRLCRFPCDKLMTPACREAMDEDSVTTGNGAKIVIAMADNNLPLIIDINAVKKMIPTILQNFINSGQGTDYWYTVIKGWQTKDDGLWGGVFSAKIYDKAHLKDNLFPLGLGNKYKELIVKVTGSAETYDNTDPKAAANKKAMITNYRTDRWYNIIYINPDPKSPDKGLKVGYVPVSSVVIKDSIFKITDSSGYYLYQKPLSNTCTKKEKDKNGKEITKTFSCPLQYSNHPERYIDKILLHNTGSGGIPNFTTYAYGVHYFLSRGGDNAFHGFTPEYMSSGTIGLEETEQKSISVEMVNWEWANPAKEFSDQKNRMVKDGQFNNFDFKKLKGNYDSTKLNNVDHYVSISGSKYELVNYYFQEKNGYFEAFNADDKKLPQAGINLKNSIRADHTVFDRFYILGKDNKNQNAYILKKEFKLIIDSGSDSKKQLEPLFTVLNKIPFEHKFFTYYTSPTALDIKRVINPAGTFPFDVYKLPGVPKDQALTDNEIPDYYEKYTPEQYINLEKFIKDMNEKYGIEINTFQYELPNGIPSKYGFYYQKSSSDEVMDKTIDFKGIISHRNSKYNGKMCPSPGFQIDNISYLKK
jgi:hypothetical protein